MEFHDINIKRGVPDVLCLYMYLETIYLFTNSLVPLDTNKQTLQRPQLSIAGQELWLNGIFEIYRRMREKSNFGPYLVQFDDIAITVLPNVYAPGFFTDSSWFAHQLPDIVGGRSLLEIGTGARASLRSHVHDAALVL